MDPAGRVALDVGASTGGFTDCLLQRGAARVYAVDVGYGQLDWRLRQDPRVVVLEKTNIRYLETLPERPSLAVADTSFISLRLVLPAICRLTGEEAEAVVLVKPQFEAGRGQVGKGGVVRDDAVRQAVVDDLAAWAAANGWEVRGVTTSPITGPAGQRGVPDAPGQDRRRRAPRRLDTCPATYLLRCADGTFYGGWTVDLEARLAAHNAGKASRYTRSRLPVALACVEEWATESEARRREPVLKRLSRARKEQLCREYRGSAASSGESGPSAGAEGEDRHE